MAGSSIFLAFFFVTTVCYACNVTGNVKLDLKFPFPADNNIMMELTTTNAAGVATTSFYIERYVASTGNVMLHMENDSAVDCWLYSGKNLSQLVQFQGRYIDVFVYVVPIYLLCSYIAKIEKFCIINAYPNSHELCGMNCATGGERCVVTRYHYRCVVRVPFCCIIYI